MDITLKDLLAEVAHHLQDDPATITPTGPRRRTSEILAAALTRATQGEDPVVVLEDMDEQLGQLPASLEAACSPVWGPVPAAA